MSQSLNRRTLISGGAALSAAACAHSITDATQAAEARNQNAAPVDRPSSVIVPPSGKRILLSCKLSMISNKRGSLEIGLVERLKMAAEAGFDGVDFDEAGKFTVEQARAAVWESGVFCHNAINHDHWNSRLTSPDPAVRAKGVANIEHCLRVSHAIGGSAVLIVVGKGGDGSAEEVDARAQTEIKKLIPLAASLGQMILFENVWNQMHYDHNQPPEQTPDRYIRFVDSFNSPWVGMYYDIGNHWKYGQPRAWLNAFGRRAVKLDVKGYSRAKSDWADITSENDDLPWTEVQKGLDEIGFTGWTTAEVGGGGVERLTTVRKQMQKAFGVG
jgi:L-ribulose-5-phosphate 3-epimerase